jgi:EmrB/QacA subfamily drug resistance transporter
LGQAGQVKTPQGPTRPAADLRYGTAAGRGALAAVVLASGMGFLDSTVVNVALPVLGTDLGATLGDLQWVVNGYTLMVAAFVLLGGALGDRYGRRRVFLIGVIWFTVASVACGFAANVGTLILARVIQGAGAALLTPGSLALIQASFHPDDRSRAIGAWSGLAGVTTAIGPFVGGLLIDYASWRWIFWINAPLAVLACWLTLRYVPESEEQLAGGAALRRFDVAGALLGALALASLTYALVAWPAQGLGSVAVSGSLFVAVLAGVAFVLVERARGEDAMMPLKLFQSRVFAGLNVYTIFVYGALSGFFFFLVIFLQNVARWTALAAGVSSMPMTLLMLIFSARSGALASRIGPRMQLVAGPIFGGLGALVLSRAPMHPNYWTDILPGVVLLGVGLTLLVAPLTSTVLGCVGVQHAGVASGINNTAARAASLLAVAALPLLVGLSGIQYEVPSAMAASFRAAMLWCAGLLFVAGLVAAVVLRSWAAALRPRVAVAQLLPPSPPCPPTPRRS